MPGPTAASDNKPIPASSGTLRVGDPAAEGQPPVLVLETPAMTRTEEREDMTIYEAVVNDEEQYSIWPAHREPPPGWRKAGKSGLKPEVLAWIAEVWTDMRPKSLRDKMNGK